jgi:DNA-binding XRE family transcriptional regulator
LISAATASPVSLAAPAAISAGTGPGLAGRDFEAQGHQAVERGMVAAMVHEGAVEPLGIDHADLGLAIMIRPEPHGATADAADRAAAIPPDGRGHAGQNVLIGKGSRRLVMPPPPLRALALIEEDCRLIAIYPLIGAMPARAGRKINRIEIGTQMMARYAGGLFNLQHMLAGQAFGALQPFPDGCLRNFADGGECGLRASDLNRLHQRFEGVGSKLMAVSYSKVLVNRKTFNAPYSGSCRVPIVFRGDRLAELLNAQGMSQSQLARLVGVSQATIWKLVKEPSQGSKHTHRIARELGTSPEFLMGRLMIRHPTGVHSQPGDQHSSPGA